jgi:hypothetical protein
MLAYQSPSDEPFISMAKQPQVFQPIQEDEVTEATIVQGAEPFFYPGNHIGVLVCHGFTGTTQSMRPLGQALHATARGQPG